MNKKLFYRHYQQLKKRKVIVTFTNTGNWNVQIIGTLLIEHNMYTKVRNTSSNRTNVEPALSVAVYSWQS